MTPTHDPWGTVDRATAIVILITVLLAFVVLGENRLQASLRRACCRRPPTGGRALRLPPPTACLLCAPAHCPRREQGVRVTSRCLWDTATDNYASVSYKNVSADRQCGLQSFRIAHFAQNVVANPPTSPPQTVSAPTPPPRRTRSSAR